MCVGCLSFHNEAQLVYICIKVAQYIPFWADMCSFYGILHLFFPPSGKVLLSLLSADCCRAVWSGRFSRQWVVKELAGKVIKNKYLFIPHKGDFFNKIFDTSFALKLPQPFFDEEQLKGAVGVHAR